MRAIVGEIETVKAVGVPVTVEGLEQSTADAKVNVVDVGVRQTK